MPLLRSLSPTATRSTSIRRRRRSSCSIASPLAILVSCCYYLLLLSPRHYHHHPQTTPSLLSPVSAESSTIPRSTNRYSNYNRQSSPTSSSSAGSISSPSSSSLHDYQPPWNPSPKIDPNGFLINLYPRTPGDWEHLANIRGKYGPRSRSYPSNLLQTPVEIRQVPGDGNCLFHSIAACLFHCENDGRHLLMDSHDRILELRERSLRLRNAAVDVLEDSKSSTNSPLRLKGRRKLFLQGEEYLEARELLAAAAAQFELEGEEYCELMRKESYWGGGPEIVALCNYLQRPIHIYELVPTSKNNKNDHTTNENDTTTTTKHAKNTCSQFTLRRMACFGSPRYDRREPLHILSADSRFPDLEPKRIRRVGNHFLALFPVNKKGAGGVDGGLNQFRNHALLRGGSRVVVPSAGVASSRVDEVKKKKEDETVVRRKRKKNDERKRKKFNFKWDGGRGKWDNDNEMEKQ